MIKKLTDVQIALFPRYVKEWTDIGLSTEPADRPEAEAGIREAYGIAGLKEPEIVWTGSPLGNGVARAILLGDKKASVRDSVQDSVGVSVEASVEASVWASVWDSVWDSVAASVGVSVRNGVWASVEASVRDSVAASVGASVRASVGVSVWASVWASVEASVGASVQASVEASVGDSVLASGYGQHDAGWLSHYAYMNEVLGLRTQTEKLSGIWRISKNAGWYLPHKNICWVSERPNLIFRDERGRLHSTTGPALVYPDGWSIYSVHGVRVPEWIIERPEDITVELIDRETNAEVRRIMIDRMGRDKYIYASGAKKVHSDAFGELYERITKDGDRIMMVLVDNPTPEEDGSHKKYFLPVDPGAYGGIKTARAAVAQTWRRTDGSFVFARPDDYAPDYAS